tara:strand:+ start:1991 stop:2227 length:237 start_codon:yes stop_codon:yes gene_type:complete
VERIPLCLSRCRRTVVGIHNEENAKTNALVENVYLQGNRKEISWEDLVRGYMRRWNLTENGKILCLSGNDCWLRLLES